MLPTFVASLKKEYMEKRNCSGLLWGGLVVLAGSIYLLFNIGVLPIVWKPVFLSWQMLLITIGILQLMHRHYFGAVLFSAVGIIFLLPQLSALLGFSYSASLLHAIIWPSVIILLGVLMMTNPFIRHDNRHCWKGHKQQCSRKLNENGQIDYNLVMTGVEEIFLGPVFRGGAINTIMGGLKLDLRKTTLPEGETVLKLDSICGGVTLLIPEDWPVEIRIESIAGGFADNRVSNGTYVDRKLVIIANFVLGGGEIRC